MSFFTGPISTVVVTHGTITSYLYVMSFELNLPWVLQREYRELLPFNLNL